MSDVALSRGPIFNANGVVITREIADIRGTSYPINGIGSVRIAEPKRFGPFLLGVAALIVGAASFDSGAIGVLAIVFGLGCFLYAYRLPHILMIHTASSDRPALSGKRDPLLQIKQAIEAAVTMRG